MGVMVTGQITITVSEPVSMLHAYLSTSGTTMLDLTSRTRLDVRTLRAAVERGVLRASTAQTIANAIGLDDIDPLMAEVRSSWTLEYSPDGKVAVR